MSVVAMSDLVVVAVPKDFYTSLPLHLMKGKVVVDVSNRTTVKAKTEEYVIKRPFM